MPKENPDNSPWLGSPSGFIAQAQAQVAAVGQFAQALAALGAGLAGTGPQVPIPSGEGNAPPALQPQGTGGSASIPGVTYQGPGGFSRQVEIPEFPVFNGEAPAIRELTPPVFEAGVIPELPPVSIPSSVGTVDVVLPPVPPLLSLTFASFDGVTLPPAPTDAVPDLLLVEPAPLDYTPGTQYTSALLTQLRTVLESRITNGGTGLPPDVEQAIWDRAREREIKALEDGVLALEAMEASGMAFPPGVYLDARIKLETEFGKTTIGLSRDIAIEQAKLELTNVQEALRVAVQLEGQYLQYISQWERLAFDAARTTVESAVQIYAAKVDAYKALVDAYRTKIAIYEASVRAELAKVEVYRARIAAEQAKADVNTALVAQYKVQVDAALSAVEVFKARVVGIQAQAALEQTKVQAYAEQIRAYTARANAYTAEVEGYRAATQTEIAKQDAYRTKVEAFRALVEATGRVADARIAEFNGYVNAYEAEVESARAAAQAQASAAQAAAAAYATDAERERTQAQATASHNEVLVKQWEATMTYQARMAEVGIAAAKANSDLYVSLRSISLDASKAAAQVAAQLGAAALNAFNWSNSYGISNVNSLSVSNSTSTSTSTNTNTNYNL